MVTIDIPNGEDLNTENRNFWMYFKERLGRVPNLYASMMHSKNALSNYYQFHTRKVSLTKKEIEAVMLIVSEENQSLYCLSAHTMIGKLNGFSDEQIIQIRQGQVKFDHKLSALVSFAKSVITGKEKELNYLENCFNVGYKQENIIDILHIIGDSYITNYTTKVFNVPIDFPIAKKMNQP